MESVLIAVSYRYSSYDEPLLQELREPYIYGKIICMKKTFHLDNALLQEAKAACGANTDTETVRLGLEALVRRGAYERLRTLRGTEPQARDVPRRRERATAKRKVA